MEKRKLKDQIKELKDSMDVISAKGKTWKDSQDHKDEILTSIDEIEKLIKELKDNLN